MQPCSLGGRGSEFSHFNLEKKGKMEKKIPSDTPPDGCCEPPPLPHNTAAFVRLNNSETSKGRRKKKQAVERTCIFVISDCLPSLRQIDFYISCYWKLSGLDCQACLALSSAAKPVSGLYEPALGRTFERLSTHKSFGPIQCRFCLNHLCCCSFSPRPDFCFLFLFCFLSPSLFLPPTLFISYPPAADNPTGEERAPQWLRPFLVHTCLSKMEDLLHHDRREIRTEKKSDALRSHVHAHTPRRPQADI